MLEEYEGWSHSDSVNPLPSWPSTTQIGFPWSHSFYSGKREGMKANFDYSQLAGTLPKRPSILSL
jgi:hypothetical protein